MAQVLISQKKFKEALKLTDYISYLDLRAPIFAAAAADEGNAGNHTEASALLTRALEPMQEKSNSEMQEDAVYRVLNTQISVGDAKTSEALFTRARGLINSLPGELERVRLLTLLARALALSGEKEKASQVIDAASRITWGRSTEPDYPRSVARIVEALVATGRVLEAFDTAARIPETQLVEENRLSETPRNRSLTLVAEAAATLGKPEVGIRAAKKISDPASRAAALGAVAIGLTKS
jgi:predicted ATPase